MIYGHSIHKILKVKAVVNAHADFHPIRYQNLYFLKKGVTESIIWFNGRIVSAAGHGKLRFVVICCGRKVVILLILFTQLLFGTE